jgi:hypothetical protein
MEEDSEAFDETWEVAFVIEQHDDGPARVVRSIETHPDGSKIVTEYEEVSPGNDPYVRSRQRSVGDGPPHEIVTEFLPSPVRPPTYPAGFPFLPGRTSHTTESPAHSMSPGARWPCDDPEAVLAALVETCRAEGWTRVPASDVEPIMQKNLAVAMKRDGKLRLFHRSDLEPGSMIAMMDDIGSSHGI